ncbi:helix-turn-helix domain-containing protein, partial [Fibrobacter sp.]|uniref:helix-turn-helix domain-containing protein n=1 Tax=Fibrobacter sp. TaxID=35828 RepID=UPI003890D078
MNRIDLDTNHIIKLYQSGISEKAIAERFGCSRGAIRLRLKQSGTICRGRSESMYARMASLTAQQRKSLTVAANNAVRGRKCSHEELIKRANSREGIILNTSTYERQ